MAKGGGVSIRMGSIGRGASIGRAGGAARLGGVRSAGSLHGTASGSIEGGARAGSSSPFSSRSLEAFKPTARLVSLQNPITQANTMGVSPRVREFAAFGKKGQFPAFSENTAKQLSQVSTVDSILATAIPNGRLARQSIRPNESRTLFARPAEKPKAPSTARRGHFVDHSRGPLRIPHDTIRQFPTRTDIQPGIKPEVRQRIEPRIGQTTPLVDITRPVQINTQPKPRGVDVPKPRVDLKRAVLPRKNGVSPSEVDQAIQRVIRIRKEARIAAIRQELRSPVVLKQPLKGIVKSEASVQNAPQVAAKKEKPGIIIPTVASRAKPVEIQGREESEDEVTKYKTQVKKLLKTVTIQSTLSKDVIKSVEADLVDAEKAILLYIGLGLKPEAAQASVIAQLAQKYQSRGIDVFQKAEVKPATVASSGTEVHTSSRGKPSTETRSLPSTGPATGQEGPRKNPTGSKEPEDNTRKKNKFHFARQVLTDIKRFVTIADIGHSLLRHKAVGEVITGEEVAKKLENTVSKEKGLFSEMAVFRQDDGGLERIINHIREIKVIQSISELLATATVLIYKIPSVRLSQSKTTKFLGLEVSARDAEQVVKGQIPAEMPFSEKGVYDGILLRDKEEITEYQYVRREDMGRAEEGIPPQEDKIISFAQKKQEKLDQGRQNQLQAAV